MSEKLFAEWIGRTSEAEDVVTERMIASYRAILDPHLAPTTDGDAPLGLHWCLTPPIAPMAALGGDGHPAKSGDMPPIPNPRRMWAGGEIRFIGPLRTGDRVRRVTTIADIVKKSGRSGELWFLMLSHDYLTPRGLAVRERQDLVYREAVRPQPSPQPPATPATPQPLPRQAWPMTTTPTLLFRYSALTFNGHRIHYDHPYATGVEGYRGLVVHGPLQATWLMNRAAIIEGRTPAVFSYRGLAPVTVGEALFVCADNNDGTSRLWTQSPSGLRYMEAATSA